MRFQSFIIVAMILSLTLALAAVLAGQTGPGSIEIRSGGKVVASNQKEPAQSIRVLFIGNSLTYWNEMPWMTRQVATSLGAKPPLVTAFNGGSGASLRQHWERGRALRAIRERPWDYVVLQAQSTEILRRPDATEKYARLFDEEIRKSGARTVVFLSWIPRDSGSPQSKLTEGYQKLARSIGAIVAPVGVAWERLLRDGYELFDGSGVHPNLNGSYLAACVFYAVVYEQNPAGAMHKFDVKFEIPEFYRVDLENQRMEWATAEAIQRAAWDAVRRR